MNVGNTKNIDFCTFDEGQRQPLHTETWPTPQTSYNRDSGPTITAFRQATVIRSFVSHPPPRKIHPLIVLSPLRPINTIGQPTQANEGRGRSLRLRVKTLIQVSS